MREPVPARTARTATVATRIRTGRCPRDSGGEVDGVACPPVRSMVKAVVCSVAGRRDRARTSSKVTGGAAASMVARMSSHRSVMVGYLQAGSESGQAAVEMGLDGGDLGRGQFGHF